MESHDTLLTLMVAHYYLREPFDYIGGFGTSIKNSATFCSDLKRFTKTLLG